MEMVSAIDVGNSNDKVTGVVEKKSVDKKVFRGVILDIDTGKYLRIYKIEGTTDFILE